MQVQIRRDEAQVAPRECSAIQRCHVTRCAVHRASWIDVVAYAGADTDVVDADGSDVRTKSDAGADAIMDADADAGRV